MVYPNHAYSTPDCLRYEDLSNGEAIFALSSILSKDKRFSQTLAQSYSEK